MEIGLSVGLSPREDLRRFVDICKLAEESGVSTLWVIDSQLAMKDAYAAMSVALWETEKLKLGTGVTNIQTRHLSVTANTASTLSDMSGGRFLLGLGAGDSSVFPLGLRPSRIAVLSRAVTELRALMGGAEITDASGACYRMPFTADVTPPIFLSASQPRMLRLAGQRADGVILMGAANEDMVADQIRLVADGAVDGKRAAEEVAVDLWVTIAVDDGDRRSVDAVRSWASAKARWMSSWRTLPPSLERFRPELDRAKAEYDFASHLSVHADHAQAVSDELACALAVCGSVDDCIARLAGLSRVKPARLTLTLLSGGRERRLEVLMKEIVPALSTHSAAAASASDTTGR